VYNVKLQYQYKTVKSSDNQNSYSSLKTHISSLSRCQFTETTAGARAAQQQIRCKIFTPTV